MCRCHVRITSYIQASCRELVTAPREQLPSLDALRTLAVLLVVTQHFADFGKVRFPALSGAFDSPAFRFGWTGVDLFFVLSGFLIGRQLWRELDRSGSINIGRFILRRGFRIWPLYLAFVLISPALTNTWHYRVGDWVFLSNYIGGRVEGGWSLSTEEQFYILAPLAIVFLSRWVSLRGWLRVIPVAIVGAIVARIMTAHELLARGLETQAVKDAMYSPFHLHNAGLLVGLLAALVSVLKPDWFFGQRSLLRSPLPYLGFAAIVLGIALREYNNIVFPFLALGLIYGGLMVALIPGKAGPFGVFRATPFYTLSRLSYGMYLNHLAILRWITPAVSRVSERATGTAAASASIAMIATVACSVLFSAALFIAVERPFLDLRERFIGRRAVAGVPAEVVVEIPVAPIADVAPSAPATAPQATLAPAAASTTSQSQDPGTEA
jgi:peptidoglycan/LPS O-acetylase OafA/YrhL